MWVDIQLILVSYIGFPSIPHPQAVYTLGNLASLNKSQDTWLGIDLELGVGLGVMACRAAISFKFVGGVFPGKFRG